MALTRFAICLFLLTAVSVRSEKEEKIALVIVDVQTCFMPGGDLPVADGDKVVPVINGIREKYEDYFDLVVFTQDWHCVNHVSFASVHKGLDVYSTVDLKYNEKGELCKTENMTVPYTVDCTSYKYELKQTLWPDHCVINSTVAGLNPQLIKKPTDIVVRKGYHCQVDSYSVFYNNGEFSQTELHERLQSKGITTIVFTGLARDYCVFWSAKDAKKLGYKTLVVLDSTRSVAESTGVEAVEKMKATGIILVESDDVEEHLKKITGGSSKISPSFTVSSLLLMILLLAN